MNVETSNVREWWYLNEYGIGLDYHTAEREDKRPLNLHEVIEQSFSTKDPVGNRYELPTQLRTITDIVNGRVTIRKETVKP